jgi:23S rRNA (uracil1939-C5)-methyltransferase
MGLKGSQFGIDITHNLYGGKAAGMHDRMPVVTNTGLPGQHVLVRVKRVRETHLEAVTVAILKESPIVSEQACPHAIDCGGCTMQGVDYSNQLSLKEDQVKDLFKKRGLYPDEWLPAISSPRVFEYRNKMEFSFGNAVKGGPLTLGMHRKGRRYDVVDTPHCNIIDEDIRRIRTCTADFFRQQQTAPYHKISHQGTLRHLVVRKAAFTGEIMVNLITAHDEKLPVEDWKRILLKLPLQGSIEGILWTINDQVADTVQSDSTRILDGKTVIREKLLGLDFSITPFSFFQTNSTAAEVLYESVREWVDESDQHVFDLYSGLGTITQMMAQKARQVTGIELIEEAVTQARIDAYHNGCDNCEFIIGDVKETLDQLPGAPDMIVLDPPRAGVHPKAMEEIILISSPKIIYVSCNPRSLMDNLEQACAQGYRIRKARCIDLFPHTPHMECVVLLTNVNS